MSFVKHYFWKFLNFFYGNFLPKLAEGCGQGNLAINFLFREPNKIAFTISNLHIYSTHIPFYVGKYMFSLHNSVDFFWFLTKLLHLLQ